MKPEPIISISRRIDELGRIVIPKEVRKLFDIRAGDELEFSASNEYICMKKTHRENAMCSHCPYHKTKERDETDEKR